VTERTSRKIPVTERQFLWVQDDDKGEVTLHVGPTMVSPTAADRVVVDDGEGGFREDLSGRPQQMVELSDSQYAVLFNPLADNDGGPNGKFRAGRNESRPVRNGTRAMIPGPCSFYLRPGQRADVRDAHELASNQYLVVKVYGEVDTTAPYFQVTARSATITRATAESPIAPGSTSPDATPDVVLKRGQLIVIRGLDTQFFIPPTGVDIVPDTSVDESGAGLSAAAAQRLLGVLGPEIAPQAPVDAAYATGEVAAAYEAEAAVEQVGQAMAPRRAGALVDQSTRGRQRVMPAAPAAAAPAQAFAASPPMGGPAGAAGGGAAAALPPTQTLAEISSVQTVRRALEREARQARLVRQAVVLGEKEYCVIVDADGKREIKVGPARVFPGPYDVFMVEGSRNRVYDAYELLPQRALWLRVIAPISREGLAARLPRGFALEQDQYYPGDELLLTGVSTFFVPFNEIEVLSPQTGEAVVGNDHRTVFIEAIGIDQKSGIYVRDLATGEVRLVRGKQSYLVDPRKEVQITRTVPAADWELWIACNEPHKRMHGPVTTPWALSIIVPHNMAVLATSADGQRVIVGPCVTLLGYEETLTSVLLSTGTPKSDAAPLRTCFLRVGGNRVTDVITVETLDFVSISVRVSLSVAFLVEQKERWFHHENYIQVLVDHLRSIVRSRCRTMALATLWPQIPGVVRDTILGERAVAGGRPGRAFPENGMVVNEVEVLSADIVDPKIGELMARVQVEFVTLQIGDRQAQESLASARLRADAERQRQELLHDARERELRLAEAARKLSHEAALAQTRDREALAREQQALVDQREAAALDARLAREAVAKTAELSHLQRAADADAAAKRAVDSASLETQTRLRELEVLVIKAQSAATVAERQAVQASLVEALTALGDKAMLAEVASNMNLVSLFKGKDVGTILAEVLGGTPALPAVQALRAKFGAKVDGAGGADTA
jgi:multidrug efflux pump subunit AcrA (membrane-fusion protein)